MHDLAQNNLNQTKAVYFEQLNNMRRRGLYVIGIEHNGTYRIKSSCFTYPEYAVQKDKVETLNKLYSKQKYFCYNPINNSKRGAK